MESANFNAPVYVTMTLRMFMDLEAVIDRALIDVQGPDRPRVERVREFLRTVKL